ncbi:MAG: MucR family transcriptional regulator [Janthinobacterium lividum]
MTSDEGCWPRREALGSVDDSPHAPDQHVDGLVECRICRRRFRSLGHHLVRAHDMKVDQYRDAHGIRRTHPLTAPASRKRWQEKIAAQIAAGALDAHYAGNAERSAAARSASQRALRETRALGLPRRSSRPARPREELVKIVAAIEAGAARASALAAASISEGGFYAAIRRHPDLKARMARVAERKTRRTVTAARPGRVAGSELARIIAAVHAGHPKASLLYARIAIALLEAPDRTMTISDLSEAIGKGRDSTAVQDAIVRMETMGIVSRELRAADEHGGRAWAVMLVRAA